VRLDPNRLSWALLHRDARGYITAIFTNGRSPGRGTAGRRTAIALAQPRQAVVAKGWYHYACLKDYDTAVRYFEQARQLLPNSARFLNR